jgi:hypothetical protein
MVDAGSYGHPPKTIKAPGADFAADFQVIGGEWRESDNSIRLYINGEPMGPAVNWPSDAPAYRAGHMFLTVAILTSLKPNDTELASFGPQAAQYDYVSTTPFPTKTQRQRPPQLKLSPNPKPRLLSLFQQLQPFSLAQLPRFRSSASRTLTTENTNWHGATPLTTNH